MNILFLSDNFPPEVNAAATRVFERAVYWAKWGHKVTVITCAPNFPVGKVYAGYKNKWYQRERVSGIDVVRVKTYIAKNEGFFKRTLDFLSYMFMAIFAGSILKKPDIIVSTSPQFFTAVGGHLLGKIKRVPFVFEISDLWPESIKAVGAMKNEKILTMLENLEIFLYKKSKHIIAQTPSFKLNLISRGVDPEKISVIMNGVDTSLYFPKEKSKTVCDKFGILSGQVVVGYVGTHGMAHDLMTVLKSAESMQEVNEVKFIFLGEGATKKYLQQYRANNDIENVSFYSAVSKKEMLSIWPIFDIVLIPLLNKEAFSRVVPSKIYEAMAMGKVIVLMAPEGEASRLLLENKAGIHILPENHTLLEETIIYLISNPKETDRLSKNAREAALKNTREMQAKKMIAVLMNSSEKRTFPEPRVERK